MQAAGRIFSGARTDMNGSGNALPLRQNSDPVTRGTLEAVDPEARIHDMASCRSRACTVLAPLM